VTAHGQTKAYPGNSAWPDEQVPVLDFGKSRKSVAVSLDFVGVDTANVEDVKVFRGISPVRKAGPRMLRVEVRGLDGVPIDTFSKWHPLVRDLTGPGEVLLPRASGTVIFPLRQAVAWVVVRNLETDREVVAVDVVPAVHAFCRGNRSESECVGAANRTPTCDAGGPYVFECQGARTIGVLDGASAADADGDPLTYAWSGVFGTASVPRPTVELPGLGTWPAVLDVLDDFGGAGRCETRTSVVDTTPPDMRAVSAVPARLWPPNHKMVMVTVDHRGEDACDARPLCSLGVTSDEPVDGLGDGDTGPDWEVIDDHHVYLRAERSGRGRGRTYTITVTCSDGSGNSTTRAVDVRVPHDMN
jgi:hypothetical protein